MFEKLKQRQQQKQIADANETRAKLDRRDQVRHAIAGKVEARDFDQQLLEDHYEDHREFQEHHDDDCESYRQNKRNHLKLVEIEREHDLGVEALGKVRALRAETEVRSEQISPSQFKTTTPPLIKACRAATKELEEKKRLKSDTLDDVRRERAVRQKLEEANDELEYRTRQRKNIEQNLARLKLERDAIICEQDADSKLAAPMNFRLRSA